MSDAPAIAGRRSSPVPSIPALVFLLLALLVPTVFGHTLLNSDGDPARHLRQGREILARGDVIRVDQFTLLHQGKPYVGMEYGSQVIFALIERAFGLAGIVVLASLLIASAHALVARFLLRRGVDPLFAYGAALLSALVAYLHWLARPHLVTLLFSIILLDWLDREVPVPRWRYVLFFLLWVNLHAGFIFGLTLMSLFVAGYALDGLLQPEERRERWRRAGQLLLTTVLSGLITLVNAYGPALHRHALANLSDPYLTDHTVEFMSPNFHWLGLKFFLLALLVVILCFGLLRRPLPGPHLLVVTATIGAALQFQRNVALFAVSGLPIAALYVNRLWARLPGQSFRDRFALASRQSTTLPWIVGTAALLLLLALTGGRVGNRELIPNRFDAGIFPVEIVGAARQAGISGRLFNDFRFGGYLEYAWPEQKVFIDGATDVYGAPLMRAHATVLGLSPGWRDSLATWRIDLILLPPGEPMLSELVQDGTWGVWRCDATAALLRPIHQEGLGGDSVLTACRRASEAAPGIANLPLEPQP